MIRPTPSDAAGDDSCPHCGHEVGDSWLVCAWCGEQLAVAAELGVGARVGDGRYQILKVIGRGGFGITYDVGDRRLQRRVAMKELFPDSAVRHGSMVLTPPQGRPGFKLARERFLREARVLARFTHPGIVRVYEVFEEHGTAYLVMELLDGRTLVELLQQRGKPFPEADVLDVAGRVAAALRPVHAAGVLHRDVNPSNVMLTHHGRIVVIDFGLARDYDQDETRGMTRVVTPGYAPLEQYRGEGRFGPSTDVYGLAATCYRLATGRVPVSAVERDAGASLPAPCVVNPAISKATSDAILDGLELEPTHRPQDLDAFLARMGVARLPEGTRSPLLDLVPAPETTSAWGGSPAPKPSPLTEAHPNPEPPRFDGGVDVDQTRHEPIVPRGGSSADRAGDATHHAPIAPRVQAADPDATVAGAAPVGEAGTSLDDRTTPTPAPTPAPTPGPVPAPTVSAMDMPRPAMPASAIPRTEVPRTEVPPPRFRPSRAPSDVAVLEPRYRVVDGMPRPVGPHREGRRQVLLPMTIVAIAVGSAAPVVAVALLVLVVLPILATMGDSSAHRLRGEHGVTGGWAERRMSSGALAAPRFARNVILSLGRSVPVVLGAGMALLGRYGLENLGANALVLEVSLRAIGALAAGALVLGARHGSARFRSGLGTEELVARLAPEGRISERIVVLWIVCAFLVAGALWLTPSPFPLP